MKHIRQSLNNYSIYRMAKKSIYSFVLLICISCSSLKKVTSTEDIAISQLKLLDVYDIPYNYQFNNTTVGGLSGIDYNSKTGDYYIICDDRSNINPARFYTAKINVAENLIDTVIFTNQVFLQNENKELYPNNKQDAKRVPDPEALRYNSRKNEFIWTSEGERIINTKDTILINPSINVIDEKGILRSSFVLPQNLIMQSIEKGPRQNGVLEGMTFAEKNKYLFVNLEEPLYEDGPRAEIFPNKALVRFYKFNVKTKKNIAQYAYELDPVAYKPTPSNGFIVNGIPDILYFRNNKILVIERSFSTGRLPCTIKIFIADFSNATDIRENKSLINNTQIIVAPKKLLLDLESLGIFVDNIEGVTFGPRLKNNHQTLLFIADNNFNPIQRSQVMLFEIIP